MKTIEELEKKLNETIEYMNYQFLFEKGKISKLDDRISRLRKTVYILSVIIYFCISVLFLLDIYK